MSGRESAEAFETVILKETYHRECTHTGKKQPWRWSEAENASTSERIGNHRRFYFHNSLSSFTAPLTTAFLFSQFRVKLCLLNRSLGFMDVVCSTLQQSVATSATKTRFLKPGLGLLQMQQLQTSTDACCICRLCSEPTYNEGLQIPQSWDFAKAHKRG